MTQSNFKVGDMKPGFQSCYDRSFIGYKGRNVKHVTMDEKNKLEMSHWDHSRSYSQNFRTEQKYRFKGADNSKNESIDKHFGYQNTLNQIATHYKLGIYPTNFESTTANKF